MRIHELREKTFRETDASAFVLCVNKIDEQYGRSISVDRLLQESGGSSDVGKSDWLSVLSLTADWSIDCGSGLSLRGPGGAAVSWVWRRSELPNLKQSDYLSRHRSSAVHFNKLTIEFKRRSSLAPFPPS